MAQPDVDTDKIVFEPSLIPDSEEQAKVLYSFNNSGGQSLQLAPNQTVLPAERLRIGEAIKAYVDAVGDIESTEGPFSNDLTQDLFSAGLLSQQIEDHPRALDFFTRAQRISRINDGLNLAIKQETRTARLIKSSKGFSRCMKTTTAPEA